MPLKKGKTNKVISENIRELVHNWEKDGKIGNLRIKSRKKAIKVAVAIALKMAGKSKRK